MPSGTAEKTEPRAPEPDPLALTTRLGRVEYASSGTGPAVLCLHGSLGGYDQGLILARVLGEPHYRYLSISRPGYLGTPIELGRTPEEQADLCAAVLDALAVDCAAVMAVSGGGPAALHFALRHRQRCWALVLASVPARPLTLRQPFSFELTKVLIHDPNFAASLERTAADEPESLARTMIKDPTILARTLADEEAWGLMQETLRSTVHRMALRFAGTDNDIEVTATRDYPLERIEVPTLVLQGTADSVVPFAENGQAFAARVPGAELVALAGGEHAAIFSHREQARRAVIRFLRQHAPAAF